MTMTRTEPEYIAEVGTVAKLRLLPMYREIGLKPNWQNMQVMSVDRENRTYICRHKNGTYLERETYTVPFEMLQPPIGWQKLYDVVVSSESRKKILLWAATGRGVAVWVSHDLSSAGKQMFTPGDKDRPPHYAMYRVEVLPDASRLSFFVEEATHKKPFRAEKDRGDWKWDASARIWYRQIPVPVKGTANVPD